MKDFWIAFLVGTFFWALLAFAFTPVQGAEVFEIQDAVVLKLKEDKVAVCLIYGGYTKEEGLPLYCFFDDFRRLDRISQPCTGLKNKEGTQELVCNATRM